MDIMKFIMVGSIACLVAYQTTLSGTSAVIVDTQQIVDISGSSIQEARRTRDLELTTSVTPSTSVTRSSLTAVGEPLSAISTFNSIESQKTARAVFDPQGLDAELAGHSSSREKNFNKQQNHDVLITALPKQLDGIQAYLATYALQSNHTIGTKVYTRRNAGAVSTQVRNCSHYNSDNEAQVEFLALGGPKKDSLGLDIDGDGYACDWNPAPFWLGSSE